MTHDPAARRSIFGPPKVRCAEILKFPSGRPKNDDDTESRAALAKAHLMSKFNYSADEAQLIVDDFISGRYGAWDSAIMDLMK